MRALLLAPCLLPRTSLEEEMMDLEALTSGSPEKTRVCLRAHERVRGSRRRSLGAEQRQLVAALAATGGLTESGPPTWDAKAALGAFWRAALAW